MGRSLLDAHRSSFRRPPCRRSRTFLSLRHFLMRGCLLLCFVVLGFACSSRGDTSSPGTGGSGAGGAATTGRGGSTAAGGSATGESGTGGSATGGSATGGSGRGGSGSGGTAGASSASASVLERNNHPGRDGHFVQPALSKSAAAKMALDTAFYATYTGAVMGDPLFFDGDGGRPGI